MPGTPGYDACLLAAAGANYACLHEKRAPPLALQPACERDVVLAVRAVAEGVRRGLLPRPRAPSSEDVGAGASSGPPMTVCGGGHSELCVVDGAVLLHNSRMAKVVCHPETRTVELGPGMEGASGRNGSTSTLIL